MYTASGVFSSRLSSAPAPPSTARGPTLPLSVEVRHRARIAAARRGIMTARGDQRERQDRDRQFRSSADAGGWGGGGWGGFVGKSPDLEVISAGFDSGGIDLADADDDLARSQSLPSSCSAPSAPSVGGRAADCDDELGGGQKRGCAPKNASSVAMVRPSEHLWPSWAERPLLERWLELASSKSLASIVATAAAEVKRALDEGLLHLQGDPAEASEMVVERGGAGGSDEVGDGAQVHGDCHVGIYLLDPLCEEQDDKKLVEAARWLPREDGAAFTPDPFTVQAARTRCNYRPEIAHSIRDTKAGGGGAGGQGALGPDPSGTNTARGRSSASDGWAGRGSRRRGAFAALYMPLLAAGPAERVLGVMALSRDASQPFTALEEVCVR